MSALDRDVRKHDAPPPLARIPAAQGLLAHLIRSVRPDLAESLTSTGEIETAVIGLGRQGTRHAGLMKAFGTRVVAGVAPDRGGERIHESIPVYDSVAACMAAHPGIAVVSIWRHFSSARDGALEAIEAGIPIVVLITEGIPLRDVRDVLAAAREHGTLLLGGNTPGVIFPPEGIKIGMLPDVFHPEEPEPGQAGPRGVTIISRSGAILYHISDALAAAGIAQNGVLGVGGDGAVGARFRDLVPLVMQHEATDLVVVAGEIGGALEEFLAEDIRTNPERYPKPIVALISGARAPEGKTMGHAGAIVAPGQEYGTFRSKKAALDSVGVAVVNNQWDLVAAVSAALDGKRYFEPADYFERMRVTWEAPPERPSWGTQITHVAPNQLIVAGHPLDEIVAGNTLLEAAHLVVRLRLPEPAELAELEEIADRAVRSGPPDAVIRSGEQLSTTLARFFLLDDAMASGPADDLEPAVRTVGALGRTVRFLATALGTGDAVAGAPAGTSFGGLISRAMRGRDLSEDHERLVEALAVASIDHGVTPPSAQATILAATVRTPFSMALASGVGAITDVHGGAGAAAAEFFLRCVARATDRDLPLEEAARLVLEEATSGGRRIAGLGHRIHTQDPRREILWRLAADGGAAGPAVAVSRLIEDCFAEVRGFRLPINVDGVIGAVVADLGLAPAAAKALFILGRVAGLSAHYFEEVSTQPPMRRIDFAQAAYRGPGAPR